MPNFYYRQSIIRPSNPITAGTCWRPYWDPPQRPRSPFYNCKYGCNFSSYNVNFNYNYNFSMPCISSPWFGISTGINFLNNMFSFGRGFFGCWC